MFTTRQRSVLVDYLRVPTANLDVDSRSTLFQASAENGRRLLWPRSEAPGPAPAHRLGDLRIFASALTDDEARGVLSSGDWAPAESLVDASGATAAHVWRAADGSVFLPFSPDTALVNLWS